MFIYRVYCSLYFHKSTVSMLAFEGGGRRTMHHPPRFRI